VHIPRVTATLVLVLLLVALVLAIIEDFRTQGQSLLVWAVLCVTAALLILRLT
jgi:hypothetical protein